MMKVNYWKYEHLAVNLLMYYVENWKVNIIYFAEAKYSVITCGKGCIHQLGNMSSSDCLRIRPYYLKGKFCFTVPYLSDRHTYNWHHTKTVHRTALQTCLFTPGVTKDLWSLACSKNENWVLMLSVSHLVKSLLWEIINMISVFT